MYTLTFHFNVVWNFFLHIHLIVLRFILKLFHFINILFYHLYLFSMNVILFAKTVSRLWTKTVLRMTLLGQNEIRKENKEFLEGEIIGRTNLFKGRWSLFINPFWRHSTLKGKRRYLILAEDEKPRIKRISSFPKL